jgi:hypothetical protein
MNDFLPLTQNNSLKQTIQAAFDTELDIQGSWGYTQESATVILSTTVPISQFEHMFASMRAYMEMNLMLNENERYGSINLNEISREQIADKEYIYDKVIYEISAMNEKIYTSFINAYKEGYGKETFDMEAHFKQREEATLKRQVTHWFEISTLG